jgi:hypothetical protein
MHAMTTHWFLYDNIVSIAYTYLVIFVRIFFRSLVEAAFSDVSFGLIESIGIGSSNWSTSEWPTSPVPWSQRRWLSWSNDSLVISVSTYRAFKVGWRTSFKTCSWLHTADTQGCKILLRYDQLSKTTILPKIKLFRCTVGPIVDHVGYLVGLGFTEPTAEFFYNKD